MVNTWIAVRLGIASYIFNMFYATRFKCDFATDHGWIIPQLQRTSIPTHAGLDKEMRVLVRNPAAKTCQNWCRWIWQTCWRSLKRRESLNCFEGNVREIMCMYIYVYCIFYYTYYEYDVRTPSCGVSEVSYKIDINCPFNQWVSEYQWVQSTARQWPSCACTSEAKGLLYLSCSNAAWGFYWLVVIFPMTVKIHTLGVCPPFSDTPKRGDKFFFPTRIINSLQIGTC